MDLSRSSCAVIVEGSRLKKTYEAVADWVDCISCSAGGGFMADQHISIRAQG